MIEDRACVDNRPRWKRKLKRSYVNFKHKNNMFWHAVFWRTLWLTHTATPYSKFMCRKGWYKKFPDGRCQYCGVIK